MTAPLASAIFPDRNQARLHVNSQLIVELAILQFLRKRRPITLRGLRHGSVVGVIPRIRVKDTRSALKRAQHNVTSLLDIRRRIQEISP